MSISESIVIGVYGISGVGKSHALAKIATDRIEWRCADGSQIIEERLKEHGKTMDYFQNTMTPSQKAAVREEVIHSVRKSPGVTVIAGHCSFPTGSSPEFKDIFTSADGMSYDAIFYLEKPPSVIFNQRKRDSYRTRQDLPIDFLQRWIDHEKVVLEDKCAKFDILFEVVPCNNTDDCQDLIRRILQSVVAPAASAAKFKSEEALRAAIQADIPKADVYLLIDGDRTLCAQDTGCLFFDQIKTKGPDDPLKQIFKRYDDYTFQAFWEVAMLYAGAIPPQEYLRLSEKIGRDSVHMYQAWKSFLLSLPRTVHPILVSCSNREVWKTMLTNTDSAVRRMSIIAGNNISMHSYLIDDSAKAIVARELRKHSAGCRIISFGDSGKFSIVVLYFLSSASVDEIRISQSDHVFPVLALDVPMFHESDRAYIAVDSRFNRSMKSFIADFAQGGKPGWIYQLVDLDSTYSPVMWHEGIPIGSLSSLALELKTGTTFLVTNCASANASAQMLATQTRRADLHGPDLQRAHKEAGKFLADKVLDEYGKTMGLLIDDTFMHVQGGKFSGKAAAASNVLVLPLMRGGDPMARGVYSRFPSARFVHFYDDKDDVPGCNDHFAEILKQTDSRATVNIIVVDSVINSGKSIERAIQCIDQLVKSNNPSLNLVIFVLAGVIQKEAAERLPPAYPRARFLALRVSENKYVGKGGTDTGNRLFGTC